MGKEVDYMASVVSAYFKAEGVDVAAKPVSYPADSVDVLKPNATVLKLLKEGNTAAEVAAAVLWVHTSLDAYNSSINQGIKQAEADVTALVKQCPDTKIVMGGYSQGAAVVHDAEVYLAAHDHAAVSRIAGTLLLADPDRVPNSKAKRYGSAPAAGEGVRSYFCLPVPGLPSLPKGKVCLAAPHDVPLPATTASIANKGDLVADFQLSDVKDFSAHAKIHTSYYDTANKKLLASAATWAASMIRPVITTTRLPGATVGKAYSAELTTADHRKGSWKITSGKLPAGLSLSGDTISGTPTTASTSKFALKFTDTHGLTATATLSITVTGAYLVDLSTLCQDAGAANDSVNGCPYDGATEIGSGSFSYAAYVDDNDSSVYPSYWDLLDFPAGTCRSAQVTFGIPDSGGEPGDSAYLEVSDGASTYAGTAEYGNLETFDVPLNGQAWSVSNSATNADDEIAINMVATCSTANGSPGS